MAQIQFTFAYEDTRIAQSLAGLLKDNGHKVFLPTEDILPEKVLADEISLRLKSVDFFVIIISKHSQNSNWVNAEASKAIGYYRERKKPIIIPILFDDVNLPPEFIEVFENILIGSRENIEESKSVLSLAISRLIGESQAIEEEKQEAIAKVKENAGTYITEAITRLTAKERDYRSIAYASYFLCGAFLICAITFLLYKADFIMHSKKELTTSEQIQLGLVGFVLLALIISLARFSFLIGKSFMVESLRNSDRIHAISFGKFYLEAFGDKADWNEIKEAFQHWNIDGGSSFISQSANDFDPEIFKNIIEFTKVISSKK
ncbi:toll/interleukin-1 receptor domain-containing protein [Psychrobacillus sp. L3]|uniref:toll/interleukin-1 receptor domain-containing protein n=1 Tax=Psychrobacillus sp. L3 TaxID=3236891 RepID=UPI0036F1EE85